MPDKYLGELRITNEHGHYVAYVNGRFYGSYDTIDEAMQDIEANRDNVNEELGHI